VRRFLPCSALAFALLLPGAASALRAPDNAPSGPSPKSGWLVAPAGQSPLRAEPTVRYGAPPPPLAAAWKALIADTGDDRWTALWDTKTSRPLRLFGGSAPAPHTSKDPSIAEKSARDILLRHADLLLAGRPVTDFDLLANDEDNGLRTVLYQQMVQVGDARVPLQGALVTAQFKADRLFVLGSAALPTAPLPAAQITPEEAESAALDYLSPTQPQATIVETALVVLPLIPAAGAPRVEAAYRVLTESASPPSRTEVFVAAGGAKDPLTPPSAPLGQILATREDIRALTGSLHYQAPLRGPQTHGPFPARGAHLVSDNTPYSVDLDGQYTIDPAPASLSCFASSDIINVYNAAGDPAQLDFAPQDGGDLVWSMEDDEQGDAQISAFVHATVAKAKAREIAPEMLVLDNTLQVRVNQYDDQYVCNAFWNGSTLNFFLEYGSCNNTARVADVVYHEFGHAFHTYSALGGAGLGDPALSEGGADYFASTITGDSIVAAGFYKNGDYLREMDTDRRWPGDISWDPHETGLIFAGAMWDLRVALEQDLGPEEGPKLAHSLYRGAIRHSPNIPATYVDVLATDDDDGDLGNGTPHLCQILTAFVPHGLSPYLTEKGGTLVHDPPHVLPGQKEPYALHVGVHEAYPECPGDGAVKGITIHWRTIGASGYDDMVPDGDGFSGHIPGQTAGSQLRYYLEIKAAGVKSRYPQNVADTEYRAFIGDVTPLYCNDFESGPGDFVLGAEAGKYSDFAVGPPAGEGGDPLSAYSGQSVLGTTLTGDGLYHKSRTSFADSPVIDTGAHTHVRLQTMRWLTVEDGYFDQATILVNGKPQWENAGTDPQDGSLSHEDQEWRFEDIDLTNFLAGGNHAVQVRFALTSDALAQFGGWNIDDFCIVAWEPPPPEPVGGAGGSGGADTGGSGGAGGDSPGPGCACDIPSSAPGGDLSWTALLGALAGLAAFRRGPRRRDSEAPRTPPGQEGRAP